MGNEITSAWAKIYIGPADDTAETEEDFEALDFDQVGTLVDLPEFGDNYQEVTSDQLSHGRTKVFKGQARAVSPQITYDHDAADVGHIALVAASAVLKGDFAFKVTLGDGGDDSPETPTTFYFRGKVMGVPVQIGTANNMVRRKATISINSNILEIAAG